MHSYVHILSTDRDAVQDFLEDAESSFLQLGVAPDVRRPTALSAEEVSEYVQTPPGASDADGWRPYLTAEARQAVTDRETTIHYAGVDGMAVVDRVLRETTGEHAEVVLQSHTYTAAPLSYDVYRYDTHSEAFTHVVEGSYD